MFRVRNRSSLTFFEWKRFYWTLLPCQRYLVGSLCCWIESLNQPWSRNCQYVTTNKPPSAIAPCVKFAYCAVTKFFALGRGGYFWEGSFCGKEKNKQTNALKSHCWLYGKHIAFVVYLFHTIDQVTKMLVFEINLIIKLLPSLFSHKKFVPSHR